MIRFVKNFTLGIGLMTALAFVSCDRGGDSVEDKKSSLQITILVVKNIRY